MFASDGTFVLTSGYRHFGIHRLDMSAEKLSLRGHNGGCSGIAFSPDGATLASVGNKDGTVKFWDAATGRAVWSSDPLPGRCQFVAYSADGRLLVTTDFDSQIVRIWDVQTRKQLLNFGSSERVTWSAQFSLDGKYLATARSAPTTNSGIEIWAFESEGIGTPDARVQLKLVKSFHGRGEKIVLAPHGNHFSFTDNKRCFLWDFDATSGTLQVSLAKTRVYHGGKGL